MERPKKFDNNAYQKEYKKAHYIKMGLQMSPKDAELLQKMADSFGLSRTKLIISMLHYVAENSIDLSVSDTEEL